MYLNSLKHIPSQGSDYEASLSVHQNNRKRVIRYIELAKERGTVKTPKPEPY